MRVLIITPSFGQHGGIRNLVSWANGLLKWHEVGIWSLVGDTPKNMHVEPAVKVVDYGDYRQQPKWDDWDCLVLGSPHSQTFQNAPVKKKILFLQQLEHKFKPGDETWNYNCHQFYSSKYPMILYSKWNHQYVNRFRRGPTYYVDTSVSLVDFPLVIPSFDQVNERMVLVEGWECTNPTKDVHALGPKVAQRLKREGYYIAAFSQKKLLTLPKVPNEYHQNPSLKIMNDLYTRAAILIKATRNDARSASPLEAMTKATPTARAIEIGDDDLVHDVNCLRCGYNETELYNIAKQLLTDHDLRARIQLNGMEYIAKHSWDKVIPIVNDIIIHS